MIYAESNQKKYLFTDFHNIRAGDIKWKGPDSNDVPLRNPPEPPVVVIPDNNMISHGIRLVVQPAKKIGPCEGYVGQSSSLMYDGGIYRNWYVLGHSEGFHACYIESDDGFSWRKPEFNRFEIDGSKKNNAVFSFENMTEQGKSMFIDGFTVFYDPNGLPDEQYKMVYCTIVPKSEREKAFEEYMKLNMRYRHAYLKNKDSLYGVYGATSPDGLNWTPIIRPLFLHYTDTINGIYYDRWLGKYVMYTRDYPRDRRIISRTDSEDFVHWSPVMPLIWPGTDEPPSNDLYTNGYSQYPGEPDIHLMFPMVYERWNQTSYIKMLSSPDGLVWNEVPGGSVIKPGLPGEWDSEFIAAGKGLVPLENDRVGLIYVGTRYAHKYPRWKYMIEEWSKGGFGWACWPDGRLCAVVSDEEGEFYTFPVVPAGVKLKVNIRTRLAGWVKVGLYGCKKEGYKGADSSMRKIYDINDCDALVGDCLHKTVTWKGQEGIPIQDDECAVLHFKLRSAELFGFEWV